MIPVPTHLVKCTEKLGQEDMKSFTNNERYTENIEYQYIAKVKCSCGNEVFEILYLGKVNDYGPCVAEYDGQYFFLIKVRCTDCGEEHLLFDDDFHGWNGWICHDDEKAVIKRPNLVEWKCSNCAHTKHKVVMIINSQGEEDFVQEAGVGFDVSIWQDAFDWFTLDVKCEKCGCTTIDFISYETM